MGICVGWPTSFRIVSRLRYRYLPVYRVISTVLIVIGKSTTEHFVGCFMMHLMMEMISRGIYGM